MITYILLIAVELFLALWIKLMIPNKARQERLIAGIGMFLIFLLLALKKETVGVDIAGYKEQYEIAGLRAWGDFNYVYYENGYLLLTKLFSKMGIDFQVFTVVLYALLCHSLYLLIRNFSPNATLSLVIFICFNFLVFSISGIRQTLATAICVYAFLWCSRYTKWSALGALCLNLAAVTIHESSVVFFAVLAAVLLMNRRVTVGIWIWLTIACFLLRTQLWDLVTYVYNVQIASFSFGGMFLFLAGMTAFVAFTYLFYRSRRVELPIKEGKRYFYYDAFLVRAVFLALLCYIIFTGSTLLRANMYFTLFLIPGIPMAISKYEYRTRFVLSAAISAFLMVLFYSETLAVNQLELWPYRFFWQ